VAGLLTKVTALLKDHEEPATKKIVMPPDDLDAVIGYSPRPLQQWLEERERRYNFEVMHRRFGKTVMKIRKLMYRASCCPFERGRFAYMAPTYAQAKDIAWAYLYEYALRVYEELGLKEREWVDRSELAVYLPTWAGTTSRIRLYGVDSPKQRIRGLYLDGVVFDEFAQIPPSVWSEQVSPMLLDENRRGLDDAGLVNQWADFIFTPFGRNHAYTMFKHADAWSRGEPVRMVNPDTGFQEEIMDEDKEYFAALMKASETGVLNAKELRKHRRKPGMTQAKFDQEMECSFDAAVEGAIFAQDIEEARSQGRIKRVPWMKFLPVHTCWDLGWDDATALWFFQIQGGGLRFIDYYEGVNAGFDHYASVLADKGYRYGKMFFPHDVVNGELGTGKTRRSVLEELGIRVTVVPKHPLPDGLAAVHAILPKSEFDATRCAEGLDRLSLYRRDYDEKLQIMKQNPVHDWSSHGADALRIGAMGIGKSLFSGASFEQAAAGVY
jgi:phage terminase large subunit